MADLRRREKNGDLMRLFWEGLPSIGNIVVGLVAGFGVSLLIGLVVVHYFHDWLTKKLPAITEAQPEIGIPAGITGLIERLGFTLLVIVQPEAAPTAMMGWLGLKMAANWNKDMTPVDGEDAKARKTDWNRHAFAAILAGFVSMGFAWIGGMLARFIMGVPLTP